MKIRTLLESDYDAVISVLDSWWDERRMQDMLPRLFFKHFQDTSFVVEQDAEVLAFLVGFISQSRPGEAYIHFSGVHPQHRKSGIGKSLYTRFIDVVKKHGCERVSLVTSPVNTKSIAYHTRIGFNMLESDFFEKNVFVHKDYDGPDEDRVVFYKEI